MWENCRLYVCKSFFGEKDRCLQFKNIDDYHKWSMDNRDEIGQTSFQPMCNLLPLFDKMCLAYQNKKMSLPRICKWTPTDPIKLTMFGIFKEKSKDEFVWRPLAAT